MEGLKQENFDVVRESADRAMIAYAAKLTRAPSAIRQKDVDDLRREGFEDVDILDMAQVASYYAFVNRLASGLGVEIEPHRRTGRKG